jgi:hypothetical protein
MYMARTKKEYLRYFRSEVLPLIREQYEQDGCIDYPARREAWNNDIDCLVRDRQLPQRAIDWVCPW